MNLTFRHAPELLGKVCVCVLTSIHMHMLIYIPGPIFICSFQKENEERFYHFASGTRQFLESQKTKGTEEARREANERRARKKLEKKGKK